MSEVRITSPTGGQKGQKDCRLGAVDPLALYELGLVAGMGEEKYARFNYLKGYRWSLNVDAAFRHLLAFLSGEDRDPESGHLHTAHAMWHMGALTSFQLRQIGEDDRAPRPDVEAQTEVAGLVFTQLGIKPPCGAVSGTFWCDLSTDHDGPHCDPEGDYFNTPKDWNAKSNPWGDA